MESVTRFPHTLLLRGRALERSPAMDVTEEPFGVWTVSTRLGVVQGGPARVVGVVRLVRRGGEVGYRAELREHGVIGYYTRLLPAIAAVKEADIVVADWHRAIAPFTMSKQPVPERLKEPPIRRVGLPQAGS